MVLSVCVCYTFIVSGHILQYSYTLFVSLCPSPALFHPPQHTEGCFLSLVLGSDLITYLFSLSYSELLWLLVFCCELKFSSFPSSYQHSIQSLPPRLTTSPPTDWYCMRSVDLLFIPRISSISVLSYNFVLHHLCHFSHYLPFSPIQIASEVCNSLQGSLLCPPPSKILYRSVSVTQWVDPSKNSYGISRQPTYTSNWLAQLSLKRELSSVWALLHQHHHQQNTKEEKYFNVGKILFLHGLSKKNEKVQNKTVVTLDSTRSHFHPSVSWHPAARLSEFSKVFQACKASRGFLHYFVCSGVTELSSLHGCLLIYSTKSKNTNFCS